MTRRKLRWTQPCCDACWGHYFEARGQNHQPITVTHPEREQCAWCGEDTHSGIYVRADPNSVPYPASYDN